MPEIASDEQCSSAILEVAESGSDLSETDRERLQKTRARMDRVSRRYSVVTLIGRKAVEPRLPGFLLVFGKMKPLVMTLTTLPAIRAFRAFKFLSRLQKVCLAPYLDNLEQGVQLQPKPDINLVTRLNRYCLYAVGVYESETLERNGFKIDKHAPITEIIISRLHLSIVAHRESIMSHKPAWFLFADAHNKELVLAIQGSSSAQDWLTNLMCLPSSTGYHEGMYLAAENVDEEVRQHIVEFLEMNPQYRLVLTGHSLGGGVASILLIQWHQSENRLKPEMTDRMEAWAFAAPCCVSKEIGAQYENKIYSVCYGRDLVCRLSWGSMRDLLLTLHGLCYSMSRAGKKEIKERLQQEATVGIVSNIKLVRDYVEMNSAPNSAKTASTADCDEASSDGTGSDFDVDDLEDIEDDEAPISYRVPARPKDSKDDLSLDIVRVKIQLPLPFRQLNQIVKRRSIEYDRRLRLFQAENQRKKMVLYRIYDCCIRGPHSPTTSATPEDRNAEDELLRRTLSAVEVAAISPVTEIMAPAGRYFLIVPRIDFLEQDRPLPKWSFNRGDCAIYSFPGSAMHEIVKEPVWSMRAVTDHSAFNYAQGCAPELLRILHHVALCDEKSEMLN